MSRQDSLRPHPGFAEAQAGFDAGPAADAGASCVKPVGRLTIGSGGRLVVPAEVRTMLRLKEGDTLVASVVDGELHLMPVATAVQRAQAYVRETIGTVKDSVVDEFIREKRYEQMLEDMKT